MGREKTNLFIKLFEGSSILIKIKENQVVYLKTINYGFKHIISDVSMCLRIKPTEAETLIKGINEPIFNNQAPKDKALLGEIISARVEQIFEKLKGLIDNNTLKDLNSAYMVKDEHYIPGMETLLNDIFKKDSPVL